MALALASYSLLLRRESEANDPSRNVNKEAVVLHLFGNSNRMASILEITDECQPRRVV